MNRLMAGDVLVDIANSGRGDRLLHFHGAVHAGLPPTFLTVRYNGLPSETLAVGYFSCYDGVTALLNAIPIDRGGSMLYPIAENYGDREKGQTLKNFQCQVWIYFHKKVKT